MCVFVCVSQRFTDLTIIQTNSDCPWKKNTYFPKEQNWVMSERNFIDIIFKIEIFIMDKHRK